MTQMPLKKQRIIRFAVGKAVRFVCFGQLFVHKASISH